MNLTKAEARKLLKAAQKINGNIGKLPYPEQRVLIAKDALAQLKLEQLKPIHGEYLFLPATNERTSLEDTVGLFFVRERFAQKKRCEACALGGLFLAYADISNEAASQYGGPDSMQEQLSPYFHKAQLNLIEHFFESAYNSDGLRENRTEKTASERFTYILENIIRNHGSFIPPRKWFYEDNEVQPGSKEYLKKRLTHFALNMRLHPTCYEKNGKPRT